MLMVGAPRSGRGGRRLKSCHSDQYLARSENLIRTFHRIFRGYLLLDIEAARSACRRPVQAAWLRDCVLDLSPWPRCERLTDRSPAGRRSGQPGIDQSSGKIIRVASECGRDCLGNQFKKQDSTNTRRESCKARTIDQFEIDEPKWS